MGPSALQAFRADAPLGGADPTQQDADAILVATLIRQSLIVGVDEPAGIRIRTEAMEIARASLGDARLAGGCTYDDHSAHEDVDVIRLLAQRMEHAGWLNLAHHLLESAAEVCTEVIARGRILSDRARVSRKRGLFDLSHAQIEELIRESRRLGSADLASRAQIGLGALAQIRGNFVEMDKRGLKALQFARKAGLRRGAATAHDALGLCASLRGDYNGAVRHLWAAYRLANGAAAIEISALGNLAQTLLISGHLEDARKVARLVLNGSPPLQAALPTLGGFAMASSHLGDVTAVEWAAGQVRRLARFRNFHRDVAGALLECAAALEHIGRAEPGGVLRRRAEAMALSHGFHDMTFEGSIASGALPFLERQRFTGLAARAKAEIEEMVVPELAADVRLALA